MVKFYQEMCSVPCRTDILRGASRVPDVRGAGTRDAPLGMSAREAKKCVESRALKLFIKRCIMLNL